ncbi:MAG TPA: amidohydrolase family protein [Gemmatimonadaceae bacterium]|nr:amidohydrolase family protein [Gemmatimonadaceae bacterium]
MRPRVARPLHLSLVLALAGPGVLAAQGPGAAAAAAKAELPLKPTRTIKFTTSRASWTSLDVSPDGRTIVFDLLGDLYTVPITGGAATRLTSGMAFDAQPRFSPDGAKIVYVSDRTGGENLFVLSLDGKDTTQITKGNTNLYLSPDWSPDGKYIVASRAGGLGGAAKLWLYHVEGGTGSTLVPPNPQNPGLAQMKMTGPAFGKDGRYIWFASRTGDWQYNAVFPQYQLGVYDRETGTMTQMSSRVSSAFRPAVSPDGRFLVYGSRHETTTGLRIRDLQSGEERWLVHPIQRDDKESRASLDVLPGYAFTPDARALVVSYEGGIWRVPLDGAPPTAIPFTAEVSVETGPEVRFAYAVDDAPTFTAKQVRDLAPSPDGKRLAFVAMDRVYVMDLPNGTPRRLTSGAVTEVFPTWSPDGRSIAYITWDDKAGGHVFRAPAEGGRVQQLTRVAARYGVLAWAPDGRRIVTTRAAARDQQEAYGGFFAQLGAEFVYLPATGGEVSIIAPTAGRGAPHFTRSDSSRIYAYSPSEGLVSFRWDGTDVKAHLKVTGPIPPGAAGFDAGLEGTDLPRDLASITPRRTHLDNHGEEMEPTPQAPPAGLIVMAPQGDRALAYVGNDLYVVTVPQIGGATPTVSVAAPDNANFPVRKLTEVGAQFPAWSADGRAVHWALGNVHFHYDLDRAKQVDDSLKADAKAKAAAKADSARQQGAARPDSTQRPPVAAPAVAAAKDSTKKDKPGYKPVEHKIAISVARDLPKASAVLRGGRAITMKGNEVIEDADVVVQNSRIVAVGKRGAVPVPADARIIDVSGKTLMPGFVDTHYHPQWLVPSVHSTQTWQYLATLAYGVTTTRDPQTASTDVLTYGDRVEAGEMVGPRIYSTGPGLFLGEGIRDLEHARAVMKRYAQYYDTKTLKMYMSGNRQQRQWIIMAAKELGIMPTTEGGLDFKLNLTHAMDGYSGLEHALPITPLYEDVLELFKGTGITYSPTLLVSYGGPFGENYYYTNENLVGDAKLKRFTPAPELDGKIRRRGTGAGNSPGPGGWFMKDEYVFPKHAQFAKRLIEAGGRVGIGSHGQLQGLGYHWEMWATQSGGMANHDVLKAATILGAQGIGLEKDLGTLEGGKLADIVITDRNPLEDIRNTNTIRYVMKNGRLYDGSSLDEVYPKAQSLPSFAWQDVGPDSKLVGTKAAGVFQAGEPTRAETPKKKQ